MRKYVIAALLAAGGMSSAVAGVYSNLSTPLCDEANHVIYDGHGYFVVQSGAETVVELTLNLASLLSYANSNDYKSGMPLLLWDADVADYGLTDVADTRVPTGSRTPSLVGYWNGAVWQPGQHIGYSTLQQYAREDGSVVLRVSNSNTSGVKVSAVGADGSVKELYSAPRLRTTHNRTVSGYRVNLNYVTAVNLLTPSTLETSTYTPPPDYTAPFVSRREGGLSLGRVMFMGDSITHGVNDQTWRWQLFKTLVDNGVEAEIVGPRSGYTPGYTNLTTRDAGEAYGGVAFPNVHLAQSSGRTHNIISGSNVGMTGVNYGGHSTSGSADSYNCNTWCCLMGTNDLLSDRGYSQADFAAKMQRMLGGKVTCRSGQYHWEAGSEWGNLSRIASDVLRDSGDVLYLMSVPCWGRHGNNNAADRHIAVMLYNELLAQWVQACRRHSGLDVRFVDVNRGMVDFTDRTPFTWPDSMSNRPGRDGLHPNEQGSMIIAANLARAMGIAGRTAGLPRAAAEGQGWSEPVNGTVPSEGTINRAEGTFTTTGGYSVDLRASFGNGEVGGWRDNEAGISISLGDGENSGMLKLTEGRIMWGENILYCVDNSAPVENLRIVWHNGCAAQNVARGYYVWLGDILIGQGLPSAGAGKNGITISARGGAGKIAELRWADTALAPASTGRTSPEHAYKAHQD